MRRTQRQREEAGVCKEMGDFVKFVERRTEGGTYAKKPEPSKESHDDFIRRVHRDHPYTMTLTYGIFKGAKK